MFLFLRVRFLMILNEQKSIRGLVRGMFSPLDVAKYQFHIKVYFIFDFNFTNWLNKDNQFLFSDLCCVLISKM